MCHCRSRCGARVNPCVVVIVKQHALTRVEKILHVCVCANVVVIALLTYQDIVGGRTDIAHFYSTGDHL